MFRTAARTMIRNWNTGVMTFVLPDGREIRLDGATPGPEARLIVRDYDFIKRTISNTWWSGARPMLSQSVRYFRAWASDSFSPGFSKRAAE